MPESARVWSVLDPDEGSPAVLVILSDRKEGSALGGLLADRNFRPIVPPHPDLAPTRAKHADIVVVELSSPPGPERAACRAIRLRYPHLPIIAILEAEDAAARQTAEELGIDDLVYRPASGKELVLRVDARVSVGRSGR